RSWQWALLASGMFLLGSLSHTWVVIGFGAVLSWLVVNRLLSLPDYGKPVIAAVLTGLVGMAIVALFVQWQLSNLLEDTWTGKVPGSSPLQTINGTLYQVGWPNIILAGLGAIWIVQRRRLDLYWWIWASAAVLMAGVLGPMAMTFRQDYLFAVILPF